MALCNIVTNRIEHKNSIKTVEKSKQFLHKMLMLCSFKAICCSKQYSNNLIGIDILNIYSFTQNACCASNKHK